MQKLDQQGDTAQSQMVPGVFFERRVSDRRVCDERRCDRRVSSNGSRSLKAWVKSLTRPRIGVDRRKQGDRRKQQIRPARDLRSLLTADEINELLK